MKAINLPDIVFSSRYSNDNCGRNYISKISPVLYDKDSRICLIIYNNMRYNQCCCGFKSVLSKALSRNNVKGISICDSLWDRDAEVQEIKNVITPLLIILYTDIFLVIIYKYLRCIYIQLRATSTRRIFIHFSTISKFFIGDYFGQISFKRHGK